MFIGHFTIAYILIRLFPGIPPLVPLIGVGFPDLLWPVLILLGVEKASVNPDSPLQKYIKFTSYPYSHSLVVGTLIALAVGIVLALLVSPQAGAVFVVASASHWLLDSIMHINDLPVLGFGSDRKVGIGLWSYSRLAFAAEYIFYAVVDGAGHARQSGRSSAYRGCRLPSHKCQLFSGVYKKKSVQVGEDLCASRHFRFRSL